MLSQSSPLLNCPADLIPSFLEPLSRGDLLSVCLVCRDLRPFAEPFLYSSIDWIWLKGEVPPIGKLLRSILHRPELAAHVRSVVLAGATFYRWYTRNIPEKIEVSEDEVNLSVAFVQRIKVSRGDEWIQGLRDGVMGAYVAVLLSQLSNLMYLDIGPNFGRNTLYLGILLRSALCATSDSGLTNFPHLREVRYTLPDASGLPGKTDRTALDILPLFYLPAAEYISATIEDSTPNDFAWPVQWRPSPSNLTTLDLAHIREGHLGQILSATPALRKLRWHCFHQEKYAEENIIDLDLIAQDLAQVRGTLSDLTITAECYMYPGNLLDPYLEIKGSLRGLFDFPELVRYEVPLPFLLGLRPPATYPLGHVIPKRVEVFTMRDDLFCSNYEWPDFDTFEVLESWITKWRDSNPHLRHFHLYLGETDDEWFLPMQAKLNDLCTAAGMPSSRITKVNAGYTPTPSP